MDDDGMRVVGDSFLMDDGRARPPHGCSVGGDVSSAVMEQLEEFVVVIDRVGSGRRASRMGDRGGHMVGGKVLRRSRERSGVPTQCDGDRVYHGGGSCVPW